jgi:hypothetical protein
MAASVTKNIPVGALAIHSDVGYTAQWLANHQSRGHHTTAPPKDFYSGEIFEVSTDSSPAPVNGARASLDAVGKDGQPINLLVQLQSDASGTHFAGQLYGPILESITGGLPTGMVNIHFRIDYSNGTVKEEDIPIRIIGNVNEFLGVHRIR